ncbi:MAG: carbonic anhydrase [Rhodospirillaceae bacterium]
MQKFIAGYRKFRSTYFRDNEDFITDLMAKGQKPTALMIACSDSRIDPSLKFDVSPGEMFIVRNVAALVPPFEKGGKYHGTSAALEFAVRALEVEHVIVMGHARCGGIHALMNKPKSGDFVGAWMQIAEGARTRALAADLPPAEAQKLCEHEAVKVSLENLLTFPWVKDAVDAGKLKLHGWYFDLGTGTLYVLNEAGAFVEA